MKFCGNTTNLRCHLTKQDTKLFDLVQAEAQKRGWTESHNTTSILGVTAHYIEEEGKLKSFVLGSLEMLRRHTADNIGNYLKSLVNEWDLEKSKISAVVTDNATNIVNAVKKSAFKTVNEIEKIVDYVKSIVTWFHQSAVAASKNKQFEELHLLQSCPTRWSSVYTMIDRFLEIKTTVSEILFSHENAPVMISGSGIAVLQDILPLLRLFDTVTKDVSAEKSVTVSRLIPIHDFMSAELQEMKLKTSEGKQFLDTIKTDFRKRFENLECNYICGTSTLLDPRYKKVHHYCSGRYGGGRRGRST